MVEAPAHGGGGVHVLSRDSRHVRLGRAEAHQVSDGRGSGHDGHRDRRARGGHRDGIRGVGDLHQVPHGLHQKNDFTAFGVYRIIVGLVVLAYFGVKVLL